MTGYSENVFPGTKVARCAFHWIQVAWRKVQVGINFPLARCV